MSPPITKDSSHAKRENDTIQYIFESSLKKQKLIAKVETWTKDQVLQVLCSTVETGGLGLTKEQANLLPDLNGKLIALFSNNSSCSKIRKSLDGYFEITNVDSITEEKLNKVAEWISKQAYKRVLSKECVNQARVNQILTYNEASRYMDFMGGESLGRELSSKIQDRYSKDMGITKDKSKSPMIVFATAPGTGKTRNAMEGIECVKQVIDDISEIKPYLDYKLEFYLIMGRNGMRHGMYKSDSESNMNRNQYAERLFTIRLCYLFATHYLKIEFYEDDWKFDTLEQFANFLKADYLEPNSKVSIVVVIDEFQKLDLEYNLKEDSTNRSGLDISLNVMGGACTSLASMDILFIPIFSGLSFTPIQASIRKATHPVAHICPVRIRMSIEDISHFLSKFLDNKEKAVELGLTETNLWTHTELSKCLNLCCGYPRLIEYMLTKMYSSLPKWSEIQITIIQGIPRFTEFSNSIIDQMFSYHLTRKPVKRKDCFEGMSFESLEESGCITLESFGADVIVQPNLPFSVTVPSDNPNFTDLVSKLTTVIEKKGAQYLKQDEFESFNSSFEVAKCTAHRLLGNDKVLFSDYFLGMIPTMTLQNSKLWQESKIVMDEFNIAYEMVSSKSDNSDPSKLYCYQKTSKGADRMCIAQIEYPNGPTIPTKLLFQDILEEVGKNTELATSWIEIKDNYGNTFKHPSVLLIYCGLKYIYKLQNSLQPTTEQQLTGKINNQYPIMVLGSSEANYLELYYGKPIYHAMFRLSKRCYFEEL